MAERHPIADLLTDEMRARVRAATFVRYGQGIATPGDWGECLCPLAVAFGWPGPAWPDVQRAAELLGTSDKTAVSDFIRTVDGGDVEPDDVYAMLGCEPLEPAP